ncbi:hypothetical protein ACKLNO_02350 [Neisseriaceae bacterium B1]
MKQYIVLTLTTALLAACGGQQQSNAQDKQIAENNKQIEILKQQAEIQRLQNELNNITPASAAEQVYQLAASEVANTIPANLQEAAKQTGEIVQGTDGQQYMYDQDSGNWLLYGAIGAAMGYMAANAMQNRAMSKYQPVQKPTAAVQRVYKDYVAKNPRTIQAPTPRANPTGNSATQTKSAPTYRQTNQGYSNTRRAPVRRGFGGRRR